MAGGSPPTPRGSTSSRSLVRRTWILVLCLSLVLGSFTGSVSANDEETCDPTGALICLSPRDVEDLRFCLKDEDGDPVSGASIEVSKGAYQRSKDTDGSGCAEFEDVETSGSPTHVNATVGDHLWGHWDVDLKEQDRSGDDHHEFTRKREHPMFEKITGSPEIVGQPVKFRVKVRNIDDETRDVRAVASFGSCPKWDSKSKDGSIPAHTATDDPFPFRCNDRVAAGSYGVSVTVKTKTQWGWKASDEGSGSVGIDPQNDCGTGQDAPSSSGSPPGISQGSCQGAFYEHDDGDLFFAGTLEKTAKVSTSHGGSASNLCLLEAPGGTSHCGDFVVESKQDFHVRPKKGSNGGYSFSWSVTPPNDCGTGNDMGSPSDSVKIGHRETQFSCKGETFAGFDETECIRYDDDSTDHSVKIAAQGFDAPNPAITVETEDGTDRPMEVQHENDHIIVEVDGQKEEDNYRICMDFSKMDSNDSPSDWRMEVSAHDDCGRPADAPDSEDSTVWERSSGDLQWCFITMAEHAEDEDWFKRGLPSGADSYFGACTEDDNSGLGFALVFPDGSVELDNGQCAVDYSPSSGTYKVGFLTTSSEIAAYEWSWVWG